MKLRHVGLVIFLVLPILYGCGSRSSAPEALEPGFLSPSQVDSSMVDHVVKVRGKILWIVQNPGGYGGLYAKLGNDDGEVGVRIQTQVWDTYEEKQKAQYKEGKTVSAEGVLVRAGGGLVIVAGKVPP